MLLEVLLTLLLIFVVSSVFGYGVHWSLHQAWSGRFNRSHMTHHLVNYPTSDYLSDIYRSAGKDNTFYLFAAAAVPLVATPIILWWLGLMPLLLMGMTVGEMLVLGFLHEYIHTAFHIRNHWMNGLAAFRRWNELHFIHHQNQTTNFGIFTYWLDRMFGTFRKQGRQ